MTGARWLAGGRLELALASCTFQRRDTGAPTLSVRLTPVGARALLELRAALAAHAPAGAGLQVLARDVDLDVGYGARLATDGVQVVWTAGHGDAFAGRHHETTVVPWSVVEQVAHRPDGAPTSLAALAELARADGRAGTAELVDQLELRAGDPWSLIEGWYERTDDHLSLLWLLAALDRALAAQALEGAFRAAYGAVTAFGSPRGAEDAAGRILAAAQAVREAESLAAGVEAAARGGDALGVALQACAGRPMFREMCGLLRRHVPSVVVGEFVRRLTED